MNSYGILQTSIWLLCHAAALFWKIRFPLHARSFTLNKKMKYIHILCLLAGLLLPLIHVIITIVVSAVEYNSNDFLRSSNISFVSSGMGYRKALTYNMCFGVSEAAFLSLIFPLTFITPLLTTFIILVCFYIHKVR